MKIEVWIRTNRVGSECRDVVEIDESDLEGLDDQERATLIEETAREAAFQWVEWGWSPVEEESDGR